MARSRLLPDPFTLMLIGTVTLASLLPATGDAARALGWLTDAAVCLLFFLHGAKLSREAIWAGIGHWRLHLAVVASTFVLFPLLGIALRPMLEPLVGRELYVGILFLCCLPSTVQSSIAFVSMARGNVPAAVCSASASTLLGILFTPIAVGLLLSSHGVGTDPLASILKIGLQLLLPFVAGHLVRPWLGGFLKRRSGLVKAADQGSVLLVVYGAFGHAVVDGLWSKIAPTALLGLLLACAVILAVMLAITSWASRRAGFSIKDQITIVFCGSKKSLVSGVPMARLLVGASAAGSIVLPLMLFHQLQLMVCAVLAQRYARRAEVAPAASAPRAEGGGTR